MGDVGKRSRRRFLGLIAAGSAAAAAAPASALARVVAPKKKPAKPAPGLHGTGVTPAVAEEIRKQKAVVEQALRAVRDCPLPPGSEPAFVFAPLRAWKKGGPP